MNIGSLFPAHPLNTIDPDHLFALVFVFEFATWRRQRIAQVSQGATSGSLERSDNGPGTFLDVGAALFFRAPLGEGALSESESLDAHQNKLAKRKQVAGNL